MVSAMTGRVAGRARRLDAGYWYDSLRAPVGSTGRSGCWPGPGTGCSSRSSPHPVLTAAVDRDAGGRRAAGGGGGRDAAPRAMAARAGSWRRWPEVHVRGVAVDWAAVLGGGAAGGPADVRVPAAAVLAAAGPVAAGDVRRRGWARWGIRCWGRRWSWPGADGLVLTGRVSLAVAAVAG